MQGLPPAPALEHRDQWDDVQGVSASLGGSTHSCLVVALSGRGSLEVPCHRCPQGEYQGLENTAGSSGRAEIEVERKWLAFFKKL